MQRHVMRIRSITYFAQTEYPLNQTNYGAFGAYARQNKRAMQSRLTFLILQMER